MKQLKVISICLAQIHDDQIRPDAGTDFKGCEEYSVVAMSEFGRNCIVVDFVSVKIDMLIEVD